MPQQSPKTVLPLCWLFIVIGVVAAGVGARLMWKGVSTQNWPVVEGVVRSASVEEQHGGSHNSTTYSAHVTYSYEVDQVRYLGDKVAIGQMSASSTYAHGIVHRYPVGKKVSVHYAPGDPSEAVLETGVHGGAWLCVAIGTVFILAGCMFLQIIRAAIAGQSPGATGPSWLQAGPGGSVSMNKPPVLMGVIFLLLGIGLSFVPPEGGQPNWLMYAIGEFFACGGIMALLMRLENKNYSKMASFAFLVLFLAIFHWVSFGAGHRTATMPFAVITVLIDLILVAAFVRWIYKQSAE